MVRIFLFRFRPSSHSDEWTIVATYPDKRKAEKAYRKLERLLEDMEENESEYETDWSPGDANCWLNGREVFFTVYTSGYLDDVLSVLEKFNPEKTEYYRNYQELIIRVRVPRGSTVESLALIDEEEAKALKWLTEKCGEPKVEEDGDEQLLTFNYKGEGIYFDPELYLGPYTINLKEKRNWEVWEDED